MSRKKFLLAALSIIGLTAPVFGSYDDFVNSLDGIQINGTTLAAAPVVSRDDLAKLLNFVDCHDCHRPGTDLIQKLTSSRWDTFRIAATANFDDVPYSTSASPANNYYCVAYVADQGYMAGYPRQTSPLCGGKFCGTNNTTVADFIQVLINILAERIGSHYQMNRQKAKQRIQDPAQSALVNSYFTLQDQAIIQSQAVLCSASNCSLHSSEEFKVYLKYCTFNLAACGMQERQTAKQNFWPVAELNLLVEEGVLTDAEANQLNVNDYVDGQTVITSLSKVKEKVACTATNDQDQDGITDYQDNCYLTYNPAQEDENKNGVGDVCDSDIDGDGVKNPVGIVDDKGNINTKALLDNNSDNNTGTGKNNGTGNQNTNGNGKIDNCLLVSNPDQADSNGDGVGDACSESAYYGLSLVARKVSNGSYAFAANYTGNMTDFAWDFGDGTYGQGKVISHTFPGPGIYTVVLTALGGTRTYIATTTITVAIDVQPSLGFQIIPNPLTARAPASIDVTPVTTRPVGHIERHSNNEQKNGQDGQHMSFLYETPGTYPIIAQAYDGTQIVAYAQGSVSIDGAIGSYLTASNLTPKEGEQILFSTTTAGIQKKDIVSIKWDFGDGTTLTNTSLNQNYTYTKKGPKIVTETIYLLDGTTLVNIIDINVLAAQDAEDQGVNLIADKLVMNTNETNHYAFVLNGMDRTDVSRVIVDMGDGQTLTFTGALKNGFSYSYSNAGIYRIMSRVQKTDGLWFYPAIQVTVIGVPLCLQKLPVAGMCDMDKDTIPDMCDNDIDGDGKTNLLGLIIHQPLNCTYKTTDLDNSVIVDTIHLIASGSTLDNCSLTVNPDQKDTNGNFIGDVCESLIKVDPDSDGDGISDSADSCPDTPENFNGIDDTDGCPDFATVPDTDPGVKPVQCNVCPCPYVQNAADLVQGDKVRAVLLNSDGKTRISTSQTEIIW